MQILVPKKYLEINKETIKRSSPLIFLAGPVRGGGDWQVPMSRLIAEKVRDAVLVVPCRWSNRHKMNGYFVGEDTDKFARQLNWERFYLKEAGIGKNSGCVLFWLPTESKTNPHPGPEPYSMDTRGEIAEWRMRVKFQNARVVIGGDEDYHGLSQIQRNYSEELGYDFPIYPTMEKTAEAAIRLALS